MVDYRRLDLAIDILAEELERQTYQLRLNKLQPVKDIEVHLSQVRDKLASVVSRLDALRLDLNL